MDWMTWYQGLEKPSWTPSPGTIGLIWQCLYPIIFVTFGVVFFRVWKRTLPVWCAWPFLINLIANLLFTPIQFGLRNLTLASLDILIVWVTILWMMAVIWKHARWIALAQIPYLIWVSLATILQLSILAWN